MSSITNKRSRSTNWSEENKTTLRKLVLERAHILENKDTSTNSNAAKKLAWEDVLSCYNIISLNKRDMNQILNQWRNMKNRAKTSDHNFRKARNMTGGGPPPLSPSAEDQELIAALPNEFIVNNSPFDSDATYDQQEGPKDTAASILKTSPIQLHVEPEMPQKIKLTPSSKAKRKKNEKSIICHDYEHQLFLLAKRSREELIRQQEQLHEVRIQQEREIHSKRLNILSLEEEYWKIKIKKLEN